MPPRAGMEAQHRVHEGGPGWDDPAPQEGPKGPCEYTQVARMSLVLEDESTKQQQVEDSLLRPVWAMPLEVSWDSALWLLPCTPVRSWDPSPVKLSAWAGMAS